MYSGLTGNEGDTTQFQHSRLAGCTPNIVENSLPLPAKAAHFPVVTQIWRRVVCFLVGPPTNNLVGAVFGWQSKGSACRRMAARVFGCGNWVPHGLGRLSAGRSGQISATCQSG